MVATQTQNGHYRNYKKENETLYMVWFNFWPSFYYMFSNIIIPSFVFTLIDIHID